MTTKQMKVPGGVLHYVETGTGTPVVFVQGIWVSSGLWDDTVARLDGRARTIQVEWPLGGHREPFGDADLSPHSVAALVLEFLERLDLRGAILVGNDTGGAVCQLAVTSGHPAVERIAGLLLTNVDSYENFPPKEMIPLRDLCRSDPAEAERQFASLVNGTEGATGFMSTVCSQPLPEERAVELLANFNGHAGSRADSVKFIAGADSATTTLAAVERFAEFTRPVTVVWGDGDEIFPLRDGERLATDFPNATLVRLSGPKTFVPLDAPDALAAALEDLVERCG